MQDVITSVIEFVAIATVALMLVDFITRLFTISCDPLGHITQIQPVVSQPNIATLDWLLGHIDQVEDECYEVPSIIELALKKMKSIPALDITALKLYKLRGESVVHVDQISISLPASIRRYKLRGKEVVKLSALEALMAS